MPPSAPHFMSSLYHVCVLFQVALAATVTYDWNITWVRANPDGQYERPVIGINGQWPMPQLHWTKGDRIVASITNQLGNQSTSMHWHGMFHNGTNSMDGASGVTQCGISPGSTMVYNFTVEQAGTYWYHSHTRAQYPDGLRQMLIIADPDDPLRAQYDAEVAFTLSDWYHDEMPGLTKKFISVSNPTGAEPVPKSALMNDTQNFTVPVEPAKTYRFHLANVGAFAGQYFWIEDHTMSIVEVDGVAVEASEASMIYLTAAQRCSFLVKTKDSSNANYAMMGSMDTDLFDVLPAGLSWNVTGWLVYNETAEMPDASEVQSFDPFDDATLVPADGLELYGEADNTIKLDVAMINLDDGANYAAFNNVPYVAPKVPALYTVKSSDSAASNVSIYGTHTNSFVLVKDQIVDIVLNNQDSGKHPFHLHGHNFQVVDRAAENAGVYNVSAATTYPSVPARRDTIMVHPLSYVVLRFKADNPGVWLFHCHINWHMDSGLVATMIEAPLELQQQSIPADHYDVCRASNTLTSGNAAGQTRDLFDLSRQNTGPDYLPAGFTPRGIAALVFSVLSAGLGMCVVALYGIRPIKAGHGI